MTKQQWIFDVECYRNYFLIVFLNVETGQWSYYEKFDDIEKWPLVIPFGTLIGFFSTNYDFPMISAALLGASNEYLKHTSDQIIINNRMPWQHNFNLINIDHMDISQVLPGKASLKIYGGRIGSKRLQDLPIEPDALISEREKEKLLQYCLNDCIVTFQLFDKIKDQIALRVKLGETFNLDLRSKSDAQIAEAAISEMYYLKTGRRLSKPNEKQFIGRTYYYKPPSFLNFESSELRELLLEITQTPLTVQSTGNIKAPDNLKNRIIELSGQQYNIQIGGLHSVDNAGSFYSDSEYQIVDIDVTSYYPSIILNCEYYPENFGHLFLDIYRQFYTDRLEAKQSGNKDVSDCLKIVLNGTFGKLASKYSKMYSPALLPHVTLTGQLSLLMLIEKLQQYCISANTDGITLRYPKVIKNEIEWQVRLWEEKTRFNMEWTYYKSLHRKDVNNYFAIQDDGKIKRKGIFAKSGLNKNPNMEIIPNTAINYYDAKVNGEPESLIKRHIKDCKDIKQFLALRTVKGGAMKDGIKYGKSIRWYYSNKESTGIHYQTSGNTVPLTEGSAILMDLPDEVPYDLDYGRYIKDTEKLIKQIG